MCTVRQASMTLRGKLVVRGGAGWEPSTAAPAFEYEYDAVSRVVLAAAFGPHNRWLFSVDRAGPEDAANGKLLQKCNILRTFGDAAKLDRQTVVTVSIYSGAGPCWRCFTPDGPCWRCFTPDGPCRCHPVKMPAKALVMLRRVIPRAVEATATQSLSVVHALAQ
jgi:hypothetical protein